MEIERNAEALTPEQKAQIEAAFANITPEHIRQSKKNIDEFEKSKSNLWGGVIAIIAMFIIAYFVKYDPEYEYTWWWAWLVHSWIVVPKFIYSLFIDGMASKPELYTSGYNVWWWITIICASLSYLKVLLNLLLLPKSIKNYKAEKQGMDILKTFFPDSLNAALAEEQEK